MDTPKDSRIEDESPEVQANYYKKSLYVMKRHVFVSFLHLAIDMVQKAYSETRDERFESRLELAGQALNEIKEIIERGEY